MEEEREKKKKEEERSIGKRRSCFYVSRKKSLPSLKVQAMGTRSYRVHKLHRSITPLLVQAETIPVPLATIPRRAVECEDYAYELSPMHMLHFLEIVRSISVSMFPQHEKQHFTLQFPYMLEELKPKHS
ncbi:hypothetical protein CFP56_009840 [Quercus suber]|uniref:Uncharacterized protein n=1 Tax=Quercus suber TaxID=58331 RepID=A0AAW0L207_QUESU